MPSVDVKLGKGPAKFDTKRLMVGKYFEASLSPALPDVDYTGDVTDWGMMLNDLLGDCTIAGIGHAEQVWSLARGGEYTLPDAAIKEKYEQWCGYVDGDPSTDQGGIEVDVLNLWRRRTFWKHILTAYADVKPDNIFNLQKSIEIFGGVYIGLQLPISVQGLNLWDVSTGSNAVPGSWGGHAVFIPKYYTVPAFAGAIASSGSKLRFVCISWGELIEITQDFWLYSDSDAGPYIDEVHALVSPEFISLKTGKTPEGLDLKSLEADALAVAA